MAQRATSASPTMTTDPKPAATKEAARHRRQEVLRQIEELASSIGLTIALEPRTSPEITSAPQRRRSRSASPAPAFRLTDRDIAIIEAVNRFRYLRTGQLKRLLFRDNRSKQSVQKRLRNLSHPSQRYLGKILPYVQISEDSGGADTAYFLGPAGMQLLHARGVPVSDYAHDNSGRVGHYFLEHTLAISEFRVHLELAVGGELPLAIHRFTTDYELKRHAVSQTARRRAYKLHHEFRHPRVNKTFLVHPDALIVLGGRDPVNHPRRLFFLEIDRGSESQGHIRDKAIGYHLLRETKLFQKFGQFERFRVLFQTNSARRAENIRASLANIEGEDLIWLTDDSLVKEETVVTGPIWRDYKNRSRCIVLT